MPSFQLTDERIATYIEAFYDIDADNDDYISKGELLTLLEKTNTSCSPEQLSNILKDLKIDIYRIGKKEVLSVAKVILTKEQAKSRKASVHLQEIGGGGNRLTQWFEGNSDRPQSASFFSSSPKTTRVSMGSSDKLHKTSTSTTGNGQKITQKPDAVTVYIDGSGSSEDYDYYSYSSSDNDIAKVKDVNDMNDTTRRPSEHRKSISKSRSGIIKSSTMESNLPAISSNNATFTSEMSEIPEEMPPSYQQRPSIEDSSIGRSLPRPKSKSRSSSSRQRERMESRGGHSVSKDKNNLRSKRIKQLRDPNVRKQLARIRLYSPNFLALMTLIQILMMGYELFYNNGLEPITTNFSGGPSRLTLIQLGAKYGPCMVPDPTIPNTSVKCYKNIPIKYRQSNGSCLYYDNLAYICQMGGFATATRPDQVWRLITPMFLHYGLITLFITLFIQVKIGFRMEQQMGSVRMAIIYVISSVCGVTFSANMDPLEVTAGATGALYGLFALLYLDLLQNWPIILNPRKNLIMLTILVLAALGVGLLPFFDNYTHIGGFFGGLCAGMIFMPSVYYSDADKFKKRILRVMAAIILIISISLSMYSFFTHGVSFCPWCKYLNCVPPDAEWCKKTAI